jgi:hypothetical protein
MRRTIRARLDASPPVPPEWRVRAAQLRSVPIVVAVISSPEAELVDRFGGPVVDICRGRDHIDESRAEKQAAKLAAEVRVGSLDLPEAFTDRVEAACQLMVWSGEDESGVLNTCHGEDPTRLEDPLQLGHGRGRSFQRFEH